MENLLVSDIAKILEEKNFNIAAEELEKVTNLDCFGTENFYMILYLNGGYIDQKISHFLSQEIYGK